MAGDKTYLVFLVQYEIGRSTFPDELDVAVVYNDDAPQFYGMKEVVNKDSNFNVYATDKSETRITYAIELPNHVKTNAGDQHYISISPKTGLAILNRNIERRNPKHKPINPPINTTNADVRIVTAYGAIVGVPLVSKDISRQYISNLF